MDILIFLLLGALFIGAFFYELFFAPSVLDGLPDPNLGMEESDKKKETIRKED